MEKRTKHRIRFILVIASLAFLGLFGRLAWIQLYLGAEYEHMAFENRFNQVTLDARRGAIYDAKGRPLAVSVMQPTIIANPVEVAKSQRTEEVAAKLAYILDMDQTVLTQKLKDNANRWFMYVKRRVTEEQARDIRALKLPGISFQEEPMRIYPKGELLANFLGFVGTDNIGLSGLEIAYDSVLSGTPGKMMLELDHRGQNIPDTTQTVIPSRDGSSLVLTIDETIQYILEREIRAAVERHNPAKMGILVMDPNTGRVLGMAQYPTFNPNSFSDSDQQNWRNFLISDVYEPGSTFKTVLMAGALEEGAVSLNDQFYCGGAVKLTSGTVQCWRGLPHGNQTFVEGVQNSCNPMFVSLGLSMGKEVVYKYLNGFGFGKKTGIDLSGEAAGIVLSQRNCRELDLATMSIGQTNAVTPIQLLTAFCAITNGGSLMKPQIVKEVRDADGNVLESIEPELVRQVISPATSEKVLSVLETVVSSGTGKTAYIDGYRVGGKTGTAQKVVPGVGYSKSEFIVSFLGVAPVNDPQVVCLVVVDYPKGADVTGGAICGPIFREAMKDVLSYLQVPTQIEPQRVSAPSFDEITLQNYTGTNVSAAEAKAAAQGLTISVVGTGDVVYAQLPLPNTRMLRGGSVVLYTKLPKSLEAVQHTVVPELTGKSYDQVMDVAQECNLDFAISGSGVVMYQQPAPGVMADAGSKVAVWLEEPLAADAYGDAAGP
ncbi:MAG: penicillin-binding transpeptidase domain-containing protein [Clostridiales bacterium]|nr:penicillin-binding transpeptidase domain-containing protein [Clostridiales bacterium]